MIGRWRKRLVLIALYDTVVLNEAGPERLKRHLNEMTNNMNIVAVLLATLVFASVLNPTLRSSSFNALWGSSVFSLVTGMICFGASVATIMVNVSFSGQLVTLPSTVAALHDTNGLWGKQLELAMLCFTTALFSFLLCGLAYAAVVYDFPLWFGPVMAAVVCFVMAYRKMWQLTIQSYKDVNTAWYAGLSQLPPDSTQRMVDNAWPSCIMMACYDVVYAAGADAGSPAMLTMYARLGLSSTAPISALRLLVLQIAADLQRTEYSRFDRFLNLHHHDDVFQQLAPLVHGIPVSEYRDARLQQSNLHGRRDPDGNIKYLVTAAQEAASVDNV